MDQQTQTTVVTLGLAGFLAATFILLAISIFLASRGNASAAEINRKENKPVSNGFAVAALITLVVIFVLVLATGLIPPILLRG
jgi:predicted PurR-regulated permease PerM